MSCSLGNVELRFENSGVRIRPFSATINRSRQNHNQFDEVTAEISTAAGDYINDHAIDKEPVTIRAEGAILYRGYYPNEGVAHGRSRSNLTINDSRKLLRGGIIDKEWSAVSLKKVVEYILGRVPDPEGVFRGVQLTSPELNTEKLQFDDYDNWGFADSNGEDANWSDRFLQGLANLNRETIPLFNGDGNFDFREETPYSALLEICELWEVEMYVRSDGMLMLGLPQMASTIHPAGIDEDMWKITEFNIPENKYPVKGVYLKGNTITVPSDDNSNTASYQMVGDFEKTEARAYAGFTDIESDDVLVTTMDTSDPETLKETARRKLINRVTSRNSGNVVIDVLSSDVPYNWFEDFAPGDRMAIFLEHHDCIAARDGIYDVQSVQHKISSDGWTVTVSVSKAITNAGDITASFWYYDPTDPSMTDDAGEAP